MMNKTVACRSVGATVFALLCTVMLALCSSIAIAQTKGDVVQGQFKSEHGGMITLPAGSWTVVDTWQMKSDKQWFITALQNNDANSNTPFFVVRIQTLASRWKGAKCDVVPDKKALWAQDSHGTTTSQLVNKCTQIWDVGRVIGGWVGWVKSNEGNWWKEAAEHFGAALATYPDELAMTESEIRVFNKYGLQLNTFIKIRPFGTNYGKVVTARAINEEDPALGIWKNWLGTLLNANADSFFNNKPSQVAALGSMSTEAIVVSPKVAIVDPPRPVAAQPPVNVQSSSPIKFVVQPLPKSNSSEAIFANRKALVIGNDSYRHVQGLENAREDARAMADGLRRVGYQVTLKTDLNQKEMKAVLRNFKAQVEGGDEVLFYFAGHGVQLSNTNYLLPIDINGESEEQLKDDSIPLQRVLDDLTDQKAKFSLALIDACRDNPFKGRSRSLGTRGLTPTTAATGQMIVFSAGTGQKALDTLGASDQDKNGIFTRVFLKQMQVPGVSIDKIVRNVRTEVVGLAKSVGHEQVPAIYDQVVGDFYFKQ